MMRKAMPMVLAVVHLLRVPSAPAAEALPPREAWVPEEAIVVVEIPRPAAILDRVFDDRVVKAVSSFPPYQELLARPQSRQLRNLLEYFQRQHAADTQTLLRKLMGGGVTLAAGPAERILVIVDAEDTRLLNDVHEFFLAIARSEAEKRGQPKRVQSAEYRGLTGWTFGPNESHAIVGNRLLLSNKPDVLKAAADLRAEPGRGSLARSAAYRSARSAIGSGAAAVAYANMTVLRDLPQLQKALARTANPMATLLFAPLLGSPRDATWLAAGLAFQGDTVSLQLASDRPLADPSAPAGFATASGPDEGARPNLAVPRQIAGFSLYRDLYKFYSAKDTLFPERSSELIFFENMMGIFFTGRDLTEEVLAETLPDIRVVVARQEYDRKIGTPEVQLPAFAVVLRLRNPQKAGPIFEEAWQKALGLVNFTRGQKALPGLILDRPTEAGLKYTMAYFAPPSPPDAAVDARFNFQPCLAMPGDSVILSSTDQLTRDLIAAVQQENSQNVRPLAGKHTLGTLDGGQLASVLEANRAALVRQNMVEKGVSEEKAKGDLSLLIAALRHVRRLELQAGREGGQSRLEIQFHLQLP